MPKPKNIQEEGEVIQVEKERLQRQPITVSHTQAKRLVKKEMSEKQSEHVKKMVEANRKKWEEKRQAKEQALKNEVEQQVKQEETKQQVIVLPKRVYNRKPKIIQQVVESSDEETEESEEEIAPPPKKKKIIKQAEEHIKTIEKIDNVIKNHTPVNRYMNMIRF